MSKESVARKTDVESPGVATLEKVVGMPKAGKEAGTWERVFTVEGVHPFDEIEWKILDAKIVAENGEIKYEQKDVEFPIWWHQTNINVVASKYFRIIDGVKENSLKQIITRVAKVITDWATEQEYFNTENDANIYKQELIYALVHQYGAFNSPVWFNLGVPGRRQTASACFIQGIYDSLDSIQTFQRSELSIFASGSGSGANFSALRSSYEKLSSGAYVSGPIAWMRPLDQAAGAMKSGGSTRNAAKMVVMDMDHPDIMETLDGRPGFIRCKAVEEQRAHDLIEMGYGTAYDDPNSAYKNVMYQNANHSVSVPDNFMKSVESDGQWETKERLTSETVHTYKARDLWDEIAKAAWKCGDPGIQFTDTINNWHTTPKSGKIRSSNPCGEFLHVDNTACNLCGLNLSKFFLNGAPLDVKAFEHAVRIFVTAQNAFVNKAEYPTLEITKNSYMLRPIGLNYGDLGAVIMKLGYAYNSDEGRAVAARLASLMTGYAYLYSSKLAARTQVFPEYERNKQDMLRVMRMHQKADADILNRWNLSEDPLSVSDKSQSVWERVNAIGERHGFANSQTTLQAPLGTISFLMGMDTTGIEPAFSLVSYKSLVGGGFEKLVNRAVEQALKTLKYSDDQIVEIRDYIDQNDYIENAPHLKEEHLPVFDCAADMGPSKRHISVMGHLKMMAAIQPLITCAMSKTVNLPQETTPEQIAETYMDSWKLGLKCVALYRNGSKKSQPLSSKKDNFKEERPSGIQEVIKEIIKEVPAPRRKLPENISAKRHKFVIDGSKGYLIMGEYEDGTLGEIFIRFGKNGSTLNGLMDANTQLASIALQHGVPLEKLIRAFINTKFEPAGFTQNPDIRFATSLLDYVFKYLDIRYCGGRVSGLDARLSDQDHNSSPPISDRPSMTPDAPPCVHCGSITRRNGSCYLCETCGNTSGCS